MPRRPRPAALALALLVAAGCGSQAAPEGGAPPASAPAPPAPPQSAAAPPAAPPGTGAAPAPAPAPAPSAAPAPGRVAEATFTPAALGVPKRYFVWLPGGYDASSRRYPVIYLLHGLGGDESNWVKVGHLPKTADAMGLQAIVVMPDGDDSFYVNWASPPEYDACLAQKPPFHPAEPPASYCVKQAHYEDYVARDLVAHVDATYRTVADRNGRALAGLSMGGFGALVLAMRNKAVFSAAASHSGLVSLLYSGPHPYVKGQAGSLASLSGWGSEYHRPMRDHMLRIFGGDHAVWWAHDPTVLAGSTNDGTLALFFDCGTEDGFKFHDHALHLHEVLELRKVAHTFALVPGAHDFRLWKDRIRESLAFHAAHFRRAGL